MMNYDNASEENEAPFGSLEEEVADEEEEDLGLPELENL